MPRLTLEINFNHLTDTAFAAMLIPTKFRGILWRSEVQGDFDCS